MPVIMNVVIGGLVSAMGTFVGRILASLGMGYITYQGVEMTLTWVRNGISSGMAGLPADVLAILSAFKAGEGVAVLLSALAIRMTIDGMTSDRFRKLTTMPGEST